MCNRVSFPRVSHGKTAASRLYSALAKTLQQQRSVPAPGVPGGPDPEHLEPIGPKSSWRNAGLAILGTPGPSGSRGTLWLCRRCPVATLPLGSCSGTSLPKVGLLHLPQPPPPPCFCACPVHLRMPRCTCACRCTSACAGARCQARVGRLETHGSSPKEVRREVIWFSLINPATKGYFLLPRW